MYNTSNPAELYAGTTWELLPDNKFIKTGSSPLVQSGSNSIKITKTNLPAEKLQVESHSMTRGSMNITGSFRNSGAGNGFELLTGAFHGNSSNGGTMQNGSVYPNLYKVVNFDASKTWSGSTSSASPYTTAMGSGTPISINPEHITIKAWKRLS